jgi:hypothetical protein
MGSVRPRRASRGFDFRRPRDPGAGRVATRRGISACPSRFGKVGKTIMFWFTYPMEAARVSLEAQRLMVLSFLGLPSGQQRSEEGVSNREEAPSVGTPAPPGQRREEVGSMEMPKAAGPIPLPPHAINVCPSDLMWAEDGFVARVSPCVGLGVLAPYFYFVLRKELLRPRRRKCRLILAVSNGRRERGGGGDAIRTGVASLPCAPSGAHSAGVSNIAQTLSVAGLIECWAIGGWRLCTIANATGAMRWTVWGRLAEHTNRTIKGFIS